MPPKPKRNDVSIIFIEICFNLIPDIKFIPFVTSKIPLNKAFAIEDGMLIFLQIGSKSNVIIWVKPLVFKMDSITENSTINPPIIKMVDVAEEIDEANISPIVEILTFWSLLSCTDVLYITLFELSLFLQNLNKKPTVKLPRRCDINSKSPIKELPNIVMPTLPNIKSGPELLVKLSNLSHSCFEQILFFLKLTAIFAPTG